MKTLEKLTYRPDIDGLRALAVLVVMLYHADWLPGGYVGVDVFFVISGFLITSLIRQEQQAGTFTLRGFYARRLRRILPAALFLTLVTLLVGRWLLNPAALQGLADAALAQQVLGANVYFWLHGGYFDGPAELKPLLHTWSLAVEEQFYLVFPFLLVATRGRTRIWLLVLLGLASLALSEWWLWQDQTASYYLLSARAWELLLGALLALVPGAARSGWGGVCGLAAILVACCYYTRQTPFPGLAALCPCLGAALVIYCPVRLLAARPLTEIGLMSYSLYLWHWPLLVFARCLGQPALQALALSGCCAYLSYRFVETPFRRGSLTLGRRLLGLGGMGLILLACQVPEPPRLAKLAVVKSETAFGMPLLGDPAGPITFLLWGDSHAQAIEELCDQLAKARGLQGGATCRPGCAPLLETWGALDGPGAVQAKKKWNRDVVAWLEQHPEVQDVIICARWELHVRASGAYGQGLLRDKTLGGREAFSAGLRRTLQTLKKLRPELRVWFVRQVPVQQPARTVTRQDYAEQQRDIESALREFGALRLLGPGANWFDQQDVLRVSDWSRLFYFDNDHLSVEGAEEFMRPLLEPVFDGMLPIESSAGVEKDVE